MYTHDGIFLSKKNSEIMPSAATWMDPPIIILSKISQKEKDKYHMISLGVFPIQGSNPPVPHIQARFRKGRATRDQTANIP